MIIVALLSAINGPAASQLPAKQSFDFEIGEVAGKLCYLEKTSGCLWAEENSKWALRSPISADGDEYFRAYCDRVLIEAKRAIKN